MVSKDKNTLKIVFAGGGTGGHIYPGLAFADELRLLCSEKGKSVQIHWIGNSKGMDRDVVSKNTDFMVFLAENFAAIFLFRIFLIFLKYLQAFSVLSSFF